MGDRYEITKRNPSGQWVHLEWAGQELDEAIDRARYWQGRGYTVEVIDHSDGGKVVWP